MQERQEFLDHFFVFWLIAAVAVAFASVALKVGGRRPF